MTALTCFLSQKKAAGGKLQKSPGGKEREDLNLFGLSEKI